MIPALQARKIDAIISSMAIHRKAHAADRVLTKLFSSSHV